MRRKHTYYVYRLMIIIRTARLDTINVVFCRQCFNAFYIIITTNNDFLYSVQTQSLFFLIEAPCVPSLVWTEYSIYIVFDGLKRRIFRKSFNDTLFTLKATQHERTEDRSSKL
jgi:hypothetical protein